MQKTKEEFFNYKIEVLDATDEVMREDDGSTNIWSYGKEIRDNDIVIGLSPTNFHTFLRTKSWEVHPRFSFNKIKVLKSRPGSIRAQLLLRIRGLDQFTVNRLNDELPKLSGKRTLSCIEGVRQALYLGAGLQVPSHTSSDLYISQFIYQAITKGIYTRDGIKLQVDVIKMRKFSLSRMFKELIFAESCFNPIGIASYYWYQMRVKNSSKKVEEFDGHKGPSFFDNQLKNFIATIEGT